MLFASSSLRAQPIHTNKTHGRTVLYIYIYINTNKKTQRGLYAERRWGGEMCKDKKRWHVTCHFLLHQIKTCQSIDAQAKGAGATQAKECGEENAWLHVSR